MLDRLSRRPWGRELWLFGLAHRLSGVGRHVFMGDMDVATDDARWMVELEQA